MAQQRIKHEVRKEESSVRASISFPSELYRTLEGIAKKKKVSLAWVVRDAAERYVAEQWPLFRERK
jgi:metal-responsive CopG/Arc/MetJ family transcriptional regulator